MKSLRLPRLLLSLAAVFNGVARADSYTFDTIDAPGATGTVACAINNSGQIVGTYSAAGDGANSVNRHGFLYEGGSFSTIDVPGAAATQALGVNDVGQIVGTYTDSSGEHGFLYQDGSFSTMDVPGAASTSTSGIDNAGDIVGTYVDASHLVHGFLYRAGAFSSLDESGGVGVPGRFEVPGAAGETEAQ